MAMPWLMGLAEVRETVTLWVSAATLLATAMLNARPNGNKDFFMGLSIKSGECPILFFCVNKSLRHFAAGTRRTVCCDLSCMLKTAVGVAVIVFWHFRQPPHAAGCRTCGWHQMAWLMTSL